jgi:hypothetical protein
MRRGLEVSTMSFATADFIDDCATTVCAVDVGSGFSGRRIRSES